jgi:hypothetical protein
VGLFRYLSRMAQAKYKSVTGPVLEQTLRDRWLMANRERAGFSAGDYRPPQVSIVSLCESNAD